MAKFAQYAMVASEEALKDAGWMPTEEEDLEATVGRLCMSRLAGIDTRRRVSTSDLALAASTMHTTQR
jgi:3-oxoacyl-(acyl-carrier-protein) synthase